MPRKKIRLGRFSHDMPTTEIETINRDPARLHKFQAPGRARGRSRSGGPERIRTFDPALSSAYSNQLSYRPGARREAHNGEKMCRL